MPSTPAAKLRPIPAVGDVLIPKPGVDWSGTQLPQKPHVVLEVADMRDEAGEDVDDNVVLVIEDLVTYIHAAHKRLTDRHELAPLITPGDVYAWVTLPRDRNC